MKNAGITIGMCAIGLGLASIGFNLNGNQANATPAHFDAGPAEPTIVWYGIAETVEPRIRLDWVTQWTVETTAHVLYRAWSDGRIEAKVASVGGNPACDFGSCETWTVVSDPNQGLNAAADINFDERVDAADLGQIIAAWGAAPRNDYPPSDCPLGLIP